MNITTSKRLSEIINDFVESKLLETHVMLPGKIKSYDATNQAADILIMVKYISDVTADFDNTDDIIIPKVPISIIASSDSVGISIPVEEGTLGMLQFSDWSLADWANSDGARPSDRGLGNRNHELRDAVFTPGLRPFSRAVNFYDSSNIVLNNTDGTFYTKMSIKPDGKFSVENNTALGTNELLAVIQDIVEALEGATVVTALGASPFTPATLGVLATAKTKLLTFI